MIRLHCRNYVIDTRKTVSGISGEPLRSRSKSSDTPKWVEIPPNLPHQLRQWLLEHPRAGDRWLYLKLGIIPPLPPKYVTRVFGVWQTQPPFHPNLVCYKQITHHKRCQVKHNLFQMVCMTALVWMNMYLSNVYVETLRIFDKSRNNVNLKEKLRSRSIIQKHRRKA